MKIKFILMDVEGTTTSLSFVHETLFPFAREHMSAYLADNADDAKVKKCLKLVQVTADEEGLEGSPLELLLRFIGEDRKHPALKELQGYIWESGYESGQIKGHVYEEVPECFERWKESGLRLGIYSSGSVWAQKLLFKYSDAGDLTPFLEAHFDTGVGGKKEVASYHTIAKELGLECDEILFLTDNEDEVMAAQKAGMKVIRSSRPGVPSFDYSPQVTNFTQVDGYLI